MPDSADDTSSSASGKGGQRDLTEGPIARALFVMSAPMSMGIFAVLSVGLADAYFLSKLGETELAAVGYIYPVTTAITSLSIGLSAGANAAISQAIGAKEDGEATQRLGLHAISVGLLSGLAVAALFYLAYPLIFGAMGGADKVAEAIGQYAPFWAMSFPFLVLMMITNAVFRAHGDSVTSAFTMIVQAVINIGLNPLLIFGMWGFPEMGMMGAAVATLVGRAIAASLAMAIAWRRGMLGWCGAFLDGFVASVRRIVSVGAPAAFSNAINPAGMALVTAAVATVGDAAVAGFGAATRVQSMALVPLMALSAGIGPVVGQNWGADAQRRAQDAVHTAVWFCLGYGVLVALVLGLLAEPIAGLFASGDESQAFAAQYLRFVGLSFFGYGLLVSANSAMNARGKPLWSMGLSLARIFAVYLPLAWLGALTLGYAGIVAAAVAANLMGMWGALVATRATGLNRIDAAPIAFAATRG
ncbi:MATE family efflux transporter [Sulfitobacter albidus]|uniref:MATE family efflux transporter n=1 Tax=Sulfitobacter albidus TaxID=2829501 RepID=A0A975PL74_9RHOB|nr:MATE family efflux transporter [Sulfitobacter albidus]QUJ75081.1 MATE family efflux transporter [Sulfitobacter albidus]